MCDQTIKVVKSTWQTLNHDTPVAFCEAGELCARFFKEKGTVSCGRAVVMFFSFFSCQNFPLIAKQDLFVHDLPGRTCQ